MFGRVKRYEAGSFVLEKLFVDGVVGLGGSLFTDLKQLGDIRYVIQCPFLSHLEIDVTVAISQEELEWQVNALRLRRTHHFGYTTGPEDQASIGARR